MGVILSRFIFPKPDDLQRKNLYCRTDGEVLFTSDAVSISKAGSMTFDTYFNAFFYPKYLAYTHISDITVRLVISGEVHIRLFCWTPSKKAILLSETMGCGVEQQVSLPQCELAALPKNGALYVEVKGCSETAYLHQGWYETDTPPCHSVKAAAVICTFRREAYVSRNVMQIQQEIWHNEDCPIQTDFDVFVIDNGRTLDLKDTSHLRVFPNKNYGGSGGFARGMVEVCRSGNQYTHVLLMDDDISFETEALVKTVQLLKFAKDCDRPLWIGGQMLIEDQPSIQFEAGARYIDGRLQAIHRGLDLSQQENLLANEEIQDVQYNAWWYCCIPVDCILQKGLPLPFFIKTDDVEYGLRLKPRVLLMNGIGIWHMAFEQKYSPHLEYYIKRNELIVSALHHSGDGIWPSVWKLLRAAGKAMLTGKCKTVDFLILAYQDFLKGPDFFLNLDDEQLNSKLLEKNRDSSKRTVRHILTDPFRLLAISIRLLFHYSAVRQAFQTRASELTSLPFWLRRLGIDRGAYT